MLNDQRDKLRGPIELFSDFHLHVHLLEAGEGLARFDERVEELRASFHPPQGECGWIQVESPCGCGVHGASGLHIDTQMTCAPQHHGDVPAAFDEEVLNILEDIGLKNSDFTDSVRLQLKLKRIMDSIFEKVLAQRGIEQNIKARLEVLLLKLSGTVLCFPAISSILGVGSTVSSIFESFDKVLTSPPKSSAARGGSGQYKTEDLKNDAVISVLIDTLRLAYLAEVSVMKMGSDEELDDQRAALTARIMSIRSSPIIPMSVTIEDYYSDVITFMSCHLLCVKALSKEIVTAIEVNSKALRHEVRTGVARTDKASKKASLESISKAAKHFFAWLRADEMSLSRACRSSEIVSSVDPSIRAWLKSEEYNSAHEIVSVYKQKYHTFLTNMKIPLQTFTNADIMQAFKDVNRESVVVNGTSMKGATFTQEGIKSLLSSSAILGVSEIDEAEEAEDEREEGDDSGPSVVRNSMYQLLQIYVMLAASRTIAGGDSLCIVEDLFGGEGLILCPSRPEENGGSDPKGPSGPSLEVDMDLKELRVILQESFGLYVSDLIGKSDSALIHFRCSTITTIRLPLTKAEVVSKPHNVIQRCITVVPCR